MLHFLLFSVLNRVSDDGQLPLQIAVASGQKEAVRVLLKLGASISKQDSHLKNALHYAASGDPEVMKVHFEYLLFSSVAYFLSVAYHCHMMAFKLQKFPAKTTMLTYKNHMTVT